MASAESALRTSVADLNAVGVRWALVGGLAVSARTIPRFTKDLDFAIAVASDSEAEEAVHRLRSRGYYPIEVLEEDYVERLSGVRMARNASDVLVDLLFASSGIENEVVVSADHLEVLPRLTVPVATTPHLIALKVLAGRSQDLTDLGYLIPSASSAELDAAREAVKLIQALGSAGDRMLPPTWKLSSRTRTADSRPQPARSISQSRPVEWWLAPRPPALQKRSGGPAGYDRR